VSFRASILHLKLGLGFVLGGLLMPGVPAQAQEVCAPLLTLPGTIQTPAYDPFAQSALIDDSELGFRDASCGAPITIDTTIGWGTGVPRLSHNGHELAFSFFLTGRDFTSGLPSLGEANSPNSGVAIALPTEGSGSLQQQIRLVIPEGQIVPPGSYRFDVAGVVASGTGLLSQVQGSGEVRAAPINITTQVLAVMKLAVLGCDLSSDGATLGQDASPAFSLASTCQLNLGDMSIGMVNGDSRRARLNAQANVNFKIAMVSRNGGILKLAGRDGEVRETEQIHYSASLEGNGQAVVFDCSASDCGTSDIIAPSSSPLGSDLYFQVRVTEPEISQKRAGKYSDTITLIIQPAS
jgi:hypothetical protein